MAFTLNNFLVDRIVRGLGISQTTNKVLFSINQVQNASLTCSSESTDAVDALGTVIATFYRAKSAEFSAENAIFDLDLMATQLGTTKKVASSSSTITCPAMEIVTLTDGQTTYTLLHTPTEAPAAIYALNGDSTFGTEYTSATAASDTEFAYADGVITLPTNLSAGTQIFVMYEYDSTAAVEVVDYATEFPTTCKFVLQVLGCDVCDKENLVYAYIIFNNFKISPDFDWSIATDGTHPFSGVAQQDYCDSEKRLEVRAA